MNSQTFHVAKISCFIVLVSDTSDFFVGVPRGGYGHRDNYDYFEPEVAVMNQNAADILNEVLDRQRNQRETPRNTQDTGT